MKRILYLIVVMLVFCGCAKDEKDEKQTGDIYGIVCCKDTGEPVNAASVELGVGYYTVGYYARIATLRRTVSGNDGQYEFKDVAVDLSEYNKKYATTKVKYYVEVSKAGFKTQFYQLEVEAGKASNGDILIESLK